MGVLDAFPALFDNYFIKIIFLLHSSLLFLFGVSSGWVSTKLVITYTSYNLLLLITILLAIVVDKNVDIILVAIVFEPICAILDVIILILEYNSGFFLILFLVGNTAFRFIATLFLLKNYSCRAGVEDPTSGLLEVNTIGGSQNDNANGRNSYQNIERATQAQP